MANEKKFRVEADLLGELQVPADALYGVQTQRGINNYHISRKTIAITLFAEYSAIRHTALNSITSLSNVQECHH